MQDFTIENEKLFSELLKTDFDIEEDYYETDAKLQSVQEQLIGCYKKVRECEKTILLQAGYRVILTMMENCRNVVQFHLNLRFGKAYYLMERLNVVDFMNKNLDKEAFKKMDLEKTKDLNVVQKIAFFTLSSILIQFRQFFVDFVHKMLNKKVETDMAENFVDKCVMTPYFEDENGQHHETLDGFLKNLEAGGGKVVLSKTSRAKDGSKIDST